MITETQVREMYAENRKTIMSAVRKLPSVYSLEVAFYEDGKVCISNPILPGAYMPWDPDFMVSYKARKFMKFSELDEIMNERIAYAKLE